jgi:hypothetical protein
MKPKEIANDWALILDHTIQMGRLKILIVLGMQLSHLPFNRSLNLSDVQVLMIQPMQSSTGPKIQETLLGLKSELGVIREVLADEGPDIKSGINLYKKNNPECDYINDIVHKLAHFLKTELENSKGWEILLKKSSESRTKLFQTEYAHFSPPKRRDKARYLNLEKFIKWAYRILIVLAEDQFSIEDKEAIFKEFSWVFGLADDVKYFHQLWQVTNLTRDLIRNYGIQVDTFVILSRKLETLILDFQAQIFADKIVQFISECCEKVKSNERLIGSSEIIESLIGLTKHHFNTQNCSGFTSFTLIIAALAGEIDEQSVLNSMTKVRINHVKKWEETHFDSTIQKKQAKFCRQTALIKYEDKSGTRFRTCFKDDFEPEIA